MDELKKYIKKKYGITENKFLKVLKTSPGAEGYLLGSLGEQLFKDYITKKEYEIHRIKEKPAGGNNAKNEDAKGDFYIRKKKSTRNEWFVIECKGLKSNAEKRLNLTKKKSLLTMLKKFSVDREKKLRGNYKSSKKSYDKKKIEWEKNSPGKKFPKFNWNKNNPSSGFPDLTHLWKSEKEIQNWLNRFSDNDINEDSYWNLTAPVRLLLTHMPSSRVDKKTGIKSTGPLVSEFNILCIDLYLRTGKHEFVFANSQQLNHQTKSPNHLSQNYTIDMLTKKDGFKTHPLLEPWYNDIEKCIKETKPKPRKLIKNQLDKRKV